MKQHSANSFEPRIIIVQLKERLIEMNYSKTTIDRLDSVWRNFTQYWEEDHQLDFTLQTIQEFTSNRYGCKMGDKDRAHIKTHHYKPGWQEDVPKYSGEMQRMSVQSKVWSE